MTADFGTSTADTPEAGSRPQVQENDVQRGDDSALDSQDIGRNMAISHTNAPLDLSSRLAPAGPDPFESEHGSEDTEFGEDEWGESFEDRCHVWHEMLQEQIKEMRDVLTQEPSEQQLEEMVEKNLEHYRTYYEAKKAAARENVVKVMLGRWRSPLEAVFLWIGGWRPSMVFSLAYSKASQDAESDAHPYLWDIDITPLTDLSSEQLHAISKKQEEVKKKEDSLSEKLAMLQLALADEPILSLAERGHESDNGLNPEEMEAQAIELKALEEALDGKLKNLADLLAEADVLRLATLTEVVDLLNPLQAVQYLLAAVDLAKAIRKIGKLKMVADHHNHEEAMTAMLP